MEFLLDTADPADIERDLEIYPITGVTSNPSILKALGPVDFFSHFRLIRKLIGFERTLHIQVLAQDCEGILREAAVIREKVDDRVFIKVPTTEQGIKAIRLLKAQGVGVTATAIYSKMQGFLAIAAGADFIAPYCNRMENLDVDAWDTISALAEMIGRTGSRTKILAASFKNLAQVNSALLAGAHAVTVAPSLLHSAFDSAAIQKAVNDFAADWKSCYGDKSLCDLNTPLEEMSDFFTARVDQYDEHMLTGVEGCKEAYEEMAKLVPSTCEKLLDLGCGTGLELEKIFQRFPGLAVTGIDLTQAMLDRLKQKYSDQSLELICGSYFDIDFGKCEYDCAVSFQTMHHFSHEKKIGLYRRIKNALKTGGVYLECDYMVEDQSDEDFYYSENARMRKELGIPEQEFYHYDTPCTIENQISMLKQAGFSTVEMVFRIENTTLLIAHERDNYKQ